MNATVPVPADIRDNRDSPRFTVMRRMRMLHGPSGLSSGVIQDISASGAKLKLDKPEGVADSVILIDLAEGVAYEAAVVWRRSPELGVRFSRRHTLKGLVPSHLRLAKAIWQREGEVPPPPPVVMMPTRASSEEEPPPPPEPSESRKAVSALTQQWRAKLAAGGLPPN